MSASTMRVALLAIAAVIATASVTAAEVEKKSEESQADQADLERQLEEARRRLDAAAREVAELSMSMSDHMVPAIRHFTRVDRPRAMLGVNLGPRGTEELPEGVAVLSVSPGGAAESAGLKAGDILLAIGDKELKRDGDMSARDVLMKEMGKAEPGEKLKLRYRRDKKVATATVTPQAPMDHMFAMPVLPTMHGRFGTAAAMPLPPLAAMRAVGVFGSAELVPLTPKLGHYFGTEKGLLVVRAPADSRLKLEDGDVIVDIDGRTPANPIHAFRILGSYQAGEQLKLNVLRQKKRMSFEITVPDEPVGARTGSFIIHPDLLPGAPAIGITDEVMSPAVPLPPPPPGGGALLISIEDEPA